MRAGSEITSPQLEDAERARFALGRLRRREGDDRVGDGELGRRRDLGLVVLADPKRGGGEDGEVTGEVVEEAAELGARRIGRERLEAVNHDDARTALLD